MQSSFWEADSSQLAKKVHHLPNPEIHLLVHKNPSLAPTVCQMKELHSFTSCFLNIHFKINLPPMPKAYNISQRNVIDLNKLLFIMLCKHFMHSKLFLRKIY